MADFVLTEDQKFDVASSVGVSVSIIGISEIDLVNSFWTGHVSFKLKVARLFQIFSFRLVLWISQGFLNMIFFGGL